MPAGPQALEDVDGPMPSRLATLQDPGTPEQIVLDQHSLTHFPRVCLGAKCPSNPEDAIHHIENRRNVKQWCHNFSLTPATWETEGPLQIACFLGGNRHLFWTHVFDNGARL